MSKIVSQDFLDAVDRGGRGGPLGDLAQRMVITQYFWERYSKGETLEEIEIDLTPYCSDLFHLVAVTDTDGNITRFQVRLQSNGVGVLSVTELD